MDLRPVQGGQPFSPSQPQMPIPYTPVPTGYNADHQPQPSPLHAAHTRAHNKGVAGRLLLFGGIIVLLLVVGVVVLLSYLCVAHQCSRGAGRFILSTAPLGKVLTISQVVTHVPPLTVPFAIGLWSFHLGAEWLKSSNKYGPDRPTPMQYGLLLSICNGAGIAALVSSFKYIFQSRGASKAPSIAIPPMLKSSTLLLFGLLFLSYAITAGDSWFHATSKAVNIQSLSPYADNLSRSFGREINATMCDPSLYPGGSSGFEVPSCGLTGNGLAAGAARTRAEGLRVETNSSSLHQVVFTDDQTAILIQQDLPVNITFSAQTIGIKSRCMSITNQCLAPRQLQTTLDYGSDAALYINCTGSAKYNATFLMGQTALADNGNLIPGYEITSNPFNVGEVATSIAYWSTGIASDHFIDNDSGWFIHGESGAWNIIYCNVTALEVSYTYRASQFITRTTSPLPVSSARPVMALGLENNSSGSAAVSNAVNGVGLRQGSSYLDAYSSEMSRHILAMGAYLYQSRDAVDLQKENAVIGTSIDMIPLIFLLTCICIYACLVLVMLLWTLFTTTGTPYVRLASLQLTDPLMTMHALYGNPSPVSTWEERTEKRFGPEGDQDRLAVGAIPLHQHFGGSGKDYAFGVTKGQVVPIK